MRQAWPLVLCHHQVVACVCLYSLQLCSALIKGIVGLLCALAQLGSGVVMGVDLRCHDMALLCCAVVHASAGMHELSLIKLQAVYVRCGCVYVRACVLCALVRTYCGVLYLCCLAPRVHRRGAWTLLLFPAVLCLKGAAAQVFM